MTTTENAPASEVARVRLADVEALIEANIQEWIVVTRSFNTKRLDAVRGCTLNVNDYEHHGLYVSRVGSYPDVEFVDGMLILVERDRDGTWPMSIPYVVLEGEVDEDEWIASWAAGVIEEKSRKSRAAIDSERERRRKEYERLRAEFEGDTDKTAGDH